MKMKHARSLMAATPLTTNVDGWRDIGRTVTTIRQVGVLTLRVTTRPAPPSGEQP